MKTINIGLIGYGTVGSGVVKILKKQKAQFKKKYGADFVLKTIGDRSIKRKNPKGLGSVKLTKNIADVIADNNIDVIIELIGGIHPAKELVVKSLKKGKHVITANKALISHCGKELFQLARKNNCSLYFESAVGAGIPIIKNITEGVIGNDFNSIYGIINGTCNYILSEMSMKNCSFEQALQDAQDKGFAESDPTLDINGMDSAHKLSILIYLAFGKIINGKDIYREGITHISHNDIEYATSMGLTIKLLAIAKKEGNKIEARVHPTLISKKHPLASINGIYNAIFMNSSPLGNTLLSGEGAGQMAAASGVISDLVNLACNGDNSNVPANLERSASGLSMRKIDQIKTKFYIRIMVKDKPGVLSVITGVLGRHNIGINSVKQNEHDPTAYVPIIMLTDYTSEKALRLALNKIQKLPLVKGKPVAIRMERLW